ncbi:MAG TPA: FliH/SctL family protein [Candidatus Baltobacteraceae bacterium]
MTQPHDEAIDDASDDELALAREVRLFHVRVIEGVEAAVERIVTDIAADVVARELLLEPADIEAIVDRALQRFSRKEPLRVRVHREDAPRVNCGFPVAADDALRPGDAIVELRTGSVNASLGVRLSAIVAAALA